MKPFKGIALITLAVGLVLWFLSSQAPQASMQDGKEHEITLGKPKDLLVKEFLKDLNNDIEAGSILKPGAEYDEDSEDPDLPPGMAGLVDKEAYLQLRGEYIDLRRGRPFEGADEMRASALQTMERQLRARRIEGPSSLSGFDQVNWNFIGPAPIPLGQTTTNRVPVSGRTIAIAVHPTDPDTVYVGTAQGGLYKTTNGGANWTPLFDFQLDSLAIGAITIDPVDSSVVYVGTGEPNLSADSFAGKGLYIIRNANSASPALFGPFRLDSTGNDIFSGRSIGRIMVSPSDHNIVYVSTTSGTGGNPNATVLNAPRAGIYRSINAQAASPIFDQVQITGVATPNNRSVIDLQFDPGNDNVLVAAVLGAAGDGGLYRTANALAATPTFTRTLVLPDGSTNGRAELTATRTSGGVTTFYVAAGQISTAALGGPACNANSAGLVRKSTDNGVTWSAPMAGSTGFCGGQCFYDIAIAATPDNQTILLGGAAGNSSANCGVSIMKRSINGGTTFASSTTNLHADEHALAIAPSNPNIVYTGSDGGIWRSVNGGANWTSLNTAGFSATQFQGVAVHPFDRNFLMGGTQDNGTNCQNAAGSFSHCQDGDGGVALIDTNAQDTTNVTMYHTFFNQTNSQLLFERAVSTAANANGIFSWTSRGCSGTTTNNGIRCADNVLFYAPMALGPGNPNTVYYGSDRLYRSSNRGDTMTVVSQAPLIPSTPAGSGVIVTAIGISPQDDTVRIVGMRAGHVFATTTGSATLTDITGANFPPPNPADPARHPISKAVIDPNNKNTAYVTFTSFSPPEGQQIFKTTNLNDAIPTWVPASSGIPRVPVSGFAVDPQDSNSLYAGTDIGVYHSNDGGISWTPLGTGLPRVAVFDVAISNVQRLLRIATHGRGIWEIGIPGRQLPVLRDGGDLSVSQEGCAPGNGIIDGHEDVTVTLPITNIGPGPTQDLTVTLEATGGVAFPGPAAVVPSINPGGTGFADIRFNANADCGDTITLTFHLQEGGADAGTIVKTYTLGNRLANATPVENFDGVVAPALPGGWTTARTTATGPVLWVTSSTASSSAPNSAFGAGSTVAGESNFTSPVIAIPTAPTTGHKRGVQLSFRNSFNTEANFDGGILEISINGGAFTDILTAGGSFASGGYNNTIVANSGTALAGRLAWTGNSGGFITTLVNLPDAAFGQTAQFRWRLVTDSSTSPAGGGIRIDTISLNTVTFMCCEGACLLSCPTDITKPNDLDFAGAIVTFADTTYSGNCGAVSTNPASGSFFPLGPTVVTTTAARLDSSFDSCMFNVTVNDVQPPAVSNPTVDKPTLWPPEHQLVPILVSYTATDNDSVSCSLSVSSNEAINGLGDGDTAPDWQIIDDHNLFLRAERSGKGSGRIYTITVTCADPAGNSTSKSTSVRIPKSQAIR